MGATNDSPPGTADLPGLPDTSIGFHQEGKQHTDTITRRLPGNYGKLWEVGGEPKTQKKI
eukprot:8976580-Pyramimonas_sp.AAC.1